MTKHEIAYEVARGLIETGVEGGFDAVSCSTAGDYPSIGCSQWEGARGDYLLSLIPDGDYFAERTYTSIVGTGELQELKDLLGSEAGQAAQLDLLTEDCKTYVETLQEIETLDDSRCMIYAGMWCPTSHYVVKKFLQNRERRVNLRSMLALRNLFRDEYATAAGVPFSCYAGYANRAERTYQYVAQLDLTTPYGVLWYGKYEYGR